jgi:hypothetical protein
MANAVHIPADPVQNVDKCNAAVHARLTAKDFMASVAHWTGQPAHILLDLDSLNSFEAQLNFISHKHEELYNRTPEEVEEFNGIMKEPNEAKRVTEVVKWYQKCEKNVAKTSVDNFAPGNTAISKAVRNSTCEKLNIDDIVMKINSSDYDIVKIFNGSSADIFERLAEKCDEKVLKKVEAFWQSVRFTMHT